MSKVLLILISLLLISSLFLAFKTGKDNIGDIRTKSSSSIEDLKIIQKKNGNTLWMLTAKNADIIEKENIAELKDITLVLSQQDVSIIASKGVYDFKDKSFTTDKAVKAVGKNYKILADSIEYEIKSGDMKTDGEIRVEGKGFSIEGKGLQTEANQKVRVLKDVKATFQK
ncbi:MAG: LPS export ABC transporter periplasmic protein LptC [Nitrospirae bacterium]|nr:LPS export ABC transporter periplasmic protein LptC [Nitrospirota bacterium]